MRRRTLLHFGAVVSMPVDSLFVPVQVKVVHNRCDKRPLLPRQQKRVNQGRVFALPGTSEVLNSPDVELVNATTTSTTTTSNFTADTTKKWKAGNFEHDYQLLQTAMARQNSISNLQQLQRKYMLDHGFPKRPLFKVMLGAIFNIGGWTALLMICNRSDTSFISSWKESLSWWRKICILFSESVISMTTFHYWIVVTTLPLFLLAWAKLEESLSRTDIGPKQQSASFFRAVVQKLIGNFGPSARTLDTYFDDNQHDRNSPSFFYSHEYSANRSKRKDTTDYVLCLLENWSSAVVASFFWRLLSVGTSLASGTRSHVQFLLTLSRLITRVGAAAALYQYQSLLFELRRKDQPHPLCRPTSLMQRSVNNLLRWTPLGISTDLAALLGSCYTKRPYNTAWLGSGLTGFLISIVAPVCHLYALMKLVRISKCHDLSLSQATSFPSIHHPVKDVPESRDDDEYEVKWRYRIQWRTPQRLSQIIKTWTTYLLTNHKPLLMEMNEWNDLIRSDGFSTEGAQYEVHVDRNDDLMLHIDDIIESLSLIFRDRDAAITNATQARFTKHQESYETKTLDDVLGVAIQQTFGLGLSFNFDHFGTPSNDQDISIHQLRARMAKSAIRLKKKLDNLLSDELALLHRLKDNVAAGNNTELAEKEMRLVEEEIRGRYNSKIEQIETALMTTIPTNAMPPEGSAKFGSPIMIAEYVDVTAPFERRDLKATVLEAPDSLTQIEHYVRRDYGDQAAEAFRQQELAFRRKERDMLAELRKRHGKPNDSYIGDTDNLSEDGPQMPVDSE